MAKKSKSRTDKLQLIADLDAYTAYAEGRSLLDHGGEEDYPAILAYFRVAAEQGHADAQNDLATMLRRGYGCETDIPGAIHWYEAGAAQGVAEALYNLATIYLHAVGVAFDKARAAEYLRRAAEAGHPEAACDLGTMLRLGEGIDKDIVKAAWLHLAAAEEGDVVAVGNLCEYFEELIRPALDGNASAARALHRVHRDGYGRDSDLQLAWAWIRWAHDVCLPQGEHDDAQAVRDDFLTALHMIGPKDREVGDDWLEAIVEEHDTSIEPQWQSILECRTEGGSVTLMGLWWWLTAEWEFQRKVYDGSLAMFDEGEVIQHDSEQVGTWRKAMNLMDMYQWHRLHCAYVHPEFRKAVRKSWEHRCKDGSQPLKAGSWSERLGIDSDPNLILPMGS